MCVCVCDVYVLTLFIWYIILSLKFGARDHRLEFVQVSVIVASRSL